MYVAAFLLVLLLCWVAALRGFEIKPLVVKDYSVNRCELGSLPGAPVLRILDVVYMGALGVMDTWCQSDDLAKYYESLEARSVHRDHFDRRALFESRYDLVLAKPELIDSANQIGKRGIGYEMIAQYPDYGSQLVSLQGKPQLTKEWLRGKRLGLRDDPNSVSAYQIPMSVLRESQLLDEPDIVYFRSYREMIHALRGGKVDVIATILSTEGPGSQLQLPEGLVLAENIPGPGWFAHSELLNSPAYCAVLDALQQFSTSTGVDYFLEQRTLRPCLDDQP
jgi:hypothetical protein